jgi:DNA-binding CsgD family transcriptional regulator
MATARPAESAGLAAHVGAAALGQARAMRLTGPGGDSVPVLVTPCPQAFGPVEEPGRVLLSMAGPMAGEPSAGLLQELYRLSPAQAELCRALATGRTFEAAAQERGVAVSTMRSHFAEILRKTGAGNLRDLLRLLAALPQVRS